MKARCAGQGLDVHDREISVHAMRDVVSVWARRLLSSTLAVVQPPTLTPVNH